MLILIIKYLIIHKEQNNQKLANKLQKMKELIQKLKNEENINFINLENAKNK